MNDDGANPYDLRHAVLQSIAAIAPEADLALLRPDQPLRQQIDLDSMDWLNVLAGIERQLGCALPTAELGPQLSFDALLDCLARRAPGAPAPAAACGPAAATKIDLGGTVVSVRPIGAADRELKVDFVAGLSREARYKRFMTTVSALPKSKLRYLTEVDQHDHVALMATVERDGRCDPVGEARYVVDPAGASCEFAIALDDDFQHTGLAGALMRMLIDAARRRGLKTMEGLVLANNTAMLKFARQLGFSARHEPDDYGTVRVTLAL